MRNRGEYGELADVSNSSAGQGCLLLVFLAIVGIIVMCAVSAYTPVKIDGPLDRVEDGIEAATRNSQHEGHLRAARHSRRYRAEPSE